MPVEASLPFVSIHAKRLRWAWMVWALVIAIVCIRTIFWMRSNSVVQQYFEAGHHWASGIELYQRLNDTCRYSPMVHAIFVPFSAMPERLASVLWRLVNAALFLVGLRYWLRTVCSKRLSGSEQAAIVLLAVPLSIGSFNNGQSNVLMVGGIMLSIAAAVDRHWWLAAAGVALASTFKLYPLSLAMLMTLVLPIAFAWRYVVLIGLAMGLPFILQDPSYVARQYPRWLFNLVHDDRSGWALQSGYRDLWALIRVCKLPIDHSAYLFIQLGFAGVAALCCILMRWQGAARHYLLNMTMGLGCCWMALCGPTTESSTYILLAPIMAWSLLETWKGSVSRGVGAFTILGAALLLMGSFVVIFPFGPRIQGYGPQPLGALLLMTALVARVFTEPKPSTIQSATESDAPIFALPGKAA